MVFGDPPYEKNIERHWKNHGIRRSTAAQIICFIKKSSYLEINRAIVASNGRRDFMIQQEDDQSHVRIPVRFTHQCSQLLNRLHLSLPPSLFLKQTLLKHLTCDPISICLILEPSKKRPRHLAYNIDSIPLVGAFRCSSPQLSAPVGQRDIVPLGVT